MIINDNNQTLHHLFFGHCANLLVIVLDLDIFSLGATLPQKNTSVQNSGSGGIEKSHSCKWAKWIQWHALPHIQQSTQQRNKGYYPNLHGWDFSIPPSPKQSPPIPHNDLKKDGAQLLLSKYWGTCLILQWPEIRCTDSGLQLCMTSRGWTN